MLDRAAVERFGGDLAQVLGGVVPPDAPIALAVSGGPDSMAMLALAAAAFPGQVHAATVDHCLRAAAAAEARMVADWCVDAGVPHTTLVVAEPIGSASVQARARAVRYDLLVRWAVEIGARCLATAHHADDQAETFLMRAARGSGVAGLAGIRARHRRAIDLVRPLLGWRVSELRALAVAAAVPFVDDPSNADPHYDRTRFRALLRDTPWLDAAQLARAAAYVAEADATLREIEAWLWTTRKVTPERIDDPDLQSWLDLSDLPREVQRRMCRSAIHSVRAANGILRPIFDDSTNIEPLLDALLAGTTATQGGIMVSVRGKVWRFAPQPPRRSL
ncbi:tRNA lysidine(34) synthetase TilS [Sphingomonas echinoides]|uniref:tRNA(Ile)-lysidine synthase n=1 Tax=Sphingomonas echinoides TaxID=59803 RepID=A0ABU4PQ36_9SPHN|nr:tRNA lysidine(34) synthetase TilS [Sphingomonas echinoides]MDX5986261.1 tRNA lysidine(34) synthetase TilS [Sphingomonas echinoides]